MEFPSDFIFDPKSYVETTEEVEEEVACKDIQKTRDLEELIVEHRNQIINDNDMSVDEPNFGDDEVRNISVVIGNKLKKAQNQAKKETDELFDFQEVLDEYKLFPSFIEMRLLSKPMLKALNDNKLFEPTPIQSACIPILMAGKDICACAKTGSGKTLAFLVPILEKLMSSGSLKIGKYLQPRAVIISPTRELAMQTLNVANNLIKYCPKISIKLVVGGLKRSDQEAELRCGADIIIATPGRLIDLIYNTTNFDLKKIRYLVLDEADRMLDEHYYEQTEEIVKHCGIQRQVILFSATMTESVKKLASLSLNNPTKIFINANNEVAENLQQEFVRIRSERHKDREAILLSLVCRNFNKRTIVFMPTKIQCHRMHILLGLLGIKVGELHSNMSQIQRLDALSRFALETDPEKSVDVLVATDLASRGLDVTNIQTVINYTLPSNYERYVHRVGRTARNKNIGRAISLVHDVDRSILKQIKAHTTDEIQMRKIDPAVIEYYNEKITSLKDTIETIIENERIDRETEMAETALEKMEAAQVKKANGEEVESTKRINWFSKSNKSDLRTKNDEPPAKRMKKSQNRKEDKSKTAKPFSKKEAKLNEKMKRKLTSKAKKR